MKERGDLSFCQFRWCARDTRQSRAHIQADIGISGGGVCLACEEFGRMFNHYPPPHPPQTHTHTHPALFFKVDISSSTLILLFMPGSVQSGWATWDNCGRMFPDELRVRSFPGRFSHYAWSAAKSVHSDFVGSREYACLGVTCHLYFWQNGWGLLRATAVTQIWNGHRIRVST